MKGFIDFGLGMVLLIGAVIAVVEKSEHERILEIARTSCKP
jgi:hypothetical protein